MLIVTLEIAFVIGSVSVCILTVYFKQDTWKILFLECLHELYIDSFVLDFSYLFSFGTYVILVTDYLSVF